MCHAKICAVTLFLWQIPMLACICIGRNSVPQKAEFYFVSIRNKILFSDCCSASYDVRSNVNPTINPKEFIFLCPGTCECGISASCYSGRSRLNKAKEWQFYCSVCNICLHRNISSCDQFLNLNSMDFNDDSWGRATLFFIKLLLIFVRRRIDVLTVS